MRIKADVYENRATKVALAMVTAIDEKPEQPNQQKRKRYKQEFVCGCMC